MFSSELHFSYVSAKLFHLERFATYGIVANHEGFACTVWTINGTYITDFIQNVDKIVSKTLKLQETDNTYIY